MISILVANEPDRESVERVLEGKTVIRVTEPMTAVVVPGKHGTKMLGKFEVSDITEPSVSFVLTLPDGSVVVAETTVAQLVRAARMSVPCAPEDVGLPPA